MAPFAAITSGINFSDYPFANPVLLSDWCVFNNAYKLVARYTFVSCVATKKLEVSATDTGVGDAYATFARTFTEAHISNNTAPSTRDTRAFIGRFYRFYYEGLHRRLS
jgi:hypothetical protein